MMYMFAPHIGESSLVRSPAIAEGRWLTPEDDNAVVVPSALLQDEPELGLGKEIVLKIYGKEMSFKIVGTFLGSSFGAILYTNYDYLAAATNRVGEADALLIRTRLHDADSVDTESKALEEHFEHMGLRVSMISTLPRERADAEAIFDAIVALLLVMAILLALVGGLGLMGTMSINVLERTREIGVLRAIGAPNRAVAQVFILEGITIGLLSWSMGSLLAIPLTQGLNTALGSATMGTALTYSYSMPGLWLWLVVVLILSALASFIPARNASRLTVREVLAYE
jgi:putative ABC transport system permease protein